MKLDKRRVEVYTYAERERGGWLGLAFAVNHCSRENNLMRVTPEVLWMIFLFTLGVSPY